MVQSSQEMEKVPHSVANPDYIVPTAFGLARQGMNWCSILQ
jgi:hypothetical protein